MKKPEEFVLAWWHNPVSSETVLSANGQEVRVKDVVAVHDDATRDHIVAQFQALSRLLREQHKDCCPEPVED